MMRKIEFRGKLSHSKEWTIGNLIVAKNGYPYIIPSDVFEPDGHHLIIDSDNPYWIIPETVGQFTGLTDKNGKEIYEGDILKRCSDLYIGDQNITVLKTDVSEFVTDVFVEFVQGSFRLNRLGDKDKNYYGVINYTSNNFSDSLEIIGNIHDKK